MTKKRWRRGEVTILMPDRKSQVVPALLCEGLAINRERPGGFWVVTHAATGWALAAFSLRKEAIFAAEAVLATGSIADDLAAFEMTPPWKKLAAMNVRHQFFSEWDDLIPGEQENARSLLPRSPADEGRALAERY
jgi:hypothetical protein